MHCLVTVLVLQC